MRLRFFHQVDDLVEILVLNDYPVAWDRDDLSQALICEVLDANSNRAGFVWFTWSLADTLELHLFIFPDYRRRWMSKRIITDIQSVARLCGAEYISAYIASIPNNGMGLGSVDTPYITTRTEDLWVFLSLRSESLSRLPLRSPPPQTERLIKTPIP